MKRIRFNLLKRVVHAVKTNQKEQGTIFDVLQSTAVLFNLFVIVEPLIYFRVCHGPPLTKIKKK